MKPSTKDQKEAKWTSGSQVLLFRASKLSPGGSGHQALARVLPFSRPRPERRPRPGVAPAEKRVSELKARVEKGLYRVDTVRLAEKMIREALLENLATARRKGSSGAVR
ncbi:MAG: hypothetical protein A2V67_12125 [Deltaproteobacteria bacterium RBG_13_61_14]|nr:MAG: hypothetical protein A2V67_12125 [Deltaproteobacteria bacterium RBG_13_61_14]